MPDIATALKAEIARISRKEVRSETENLKKAVVAYRTEIAALKRRTTTLEDELRRLEKTSQKAKLEKSEVSVATSVAPAGGFSRERLAAQRNRLQLSADRLALLLGVSGQSIYNWEQGSSAPHAKHLPAIAALKGLSLAQAKELAESRKK